MARIADPSDGYKLNRPGPFTEAAEAVKSQVKPDSFISTPDKFMLSAEKYGENVLVSTFEWGEAHDEIRLTPEAAHELAEWITNNIPKVTPPEDDHSGIGHTEGGQHKPPHEFVVGVRGFCAFCDFTERTGNHS